MKLHMRNSLISSKEAAKRYQLNGAKRGLEFYFQVSDIPQVHRGDNGRYSMEKETFVILKEITDIALSEQGKGVFISKKEKAINKISLFSYIIDSFEFDKDNPKDQTFELIYSDINLDSVLEVDSKFETFNLLENHSNKVYHFGKSTQSQDTNVITFKQKPKKIHTVRGFWKSQPYGSRNNPSYKRIWIDEFQRAS